jgi:hypothetical protein
MCRRNQIVGKRLVVLFLSVLFCLSLLLTARRPVFSQDAALCPVPLTITKFERAPNRFGAEPLPIADPKTGERITTENYRIDWRLNAQLPSCLVVDRFVVNYSAHGRPGPEVSVPGSTLSTVVTVTTVGTPSLPAAGRLSATVTGVVRSQLVGDIKHTFGGIPSAPSGTCNKIPLTLDTNFADARLAVIQGSSSTRGTTPGGAVTKSPSPSLKFESGRGLRVAWQVQPTPQQLCATIEKFIVSARVTLTGGAVREGSTTVRPDSVSTIVPLLTVSPLTADQTEIQRVEEVRVLAITRPSVNLSGSFKNF